MNWNQLKQLIMHNRDNWALFETFELHCLHYKNQRYFILITVGNKSTFLLYSLLLSWRACVVFLVGSQPLQLMVNVAARVANNASSCWKKFRMKLCKLSYMALKAMIMVMPETKYHICTILTGPWMQCVGKFSWENKKKMFSLDWIGFF